jgi:hypothetical protein
MTNREAVIAEIQLNGYSDDLLDKSMTDLNLNAADVYGSVNSALVDKVAISVLQAMLLLASVNEGGYGISYSLSGIKARIDFLCARSGISSSSQPRIKMRNIW